MSEEKKLVSTHQIFIASHRKDFEWLVPCLASVNKFARGFLPPVVNLPKEDVEYMKANLLVACPNVVITTRQSRRSPSPRAPFMDAQVAMMSADTYSTADFIWILGSDSFVTAELRPETFFAKEKPVLLYASYADLQKCHPDCFCWRRGTERALASAVSLEFMRRLPLVYHRSTFAGLRQEVVNKHSLFVPTFTEYVYRMDEIYKDTSESNWLGEWAWQKERGKYEWEDVGCSSLHGAPLKKFPNPVITFWSHGGLDRPTDLIFEVNGKPVKGRTPREVMKEVLK